MPKILYKFASRSRPEKFFNAIENIRNLAHHNDYEIMASIDSDDFTMNNNEVLQRLRSYSRLRIDVGTSKNKIDAINRNMPLDFDILIVMSDDMLFTKPGFDIEVIADFEKYFPDFDGVLHYPDGSPNKHVMTMSIMGQSYYKRFGYIYHPSYESVWCDVEAMEVAKRLAKYQYVEKDIFVHNHPAWGKCVNDAQYVKTESPHVHNRDKATYASREAAGFGLDQLAKENLILPDLQPAEVIKDEPKICEPLLGAEETPGKDLKVREIVIRAITDAFGNTRESVTWKGVENLLEVVGILEGAKFQIINKTSHSHAVLSSQTT